MSGRAPSPGELDHAAEWLETYDGEGDDTEAVMIKVAEWLHEQAEAARARNLARKHGLKVADVRDWMQRNADA